MQPDDAMESFLSSRKCECVRVVECFKVWAEVCVCACLVILNSYFLSVSLLLCLLEDV